MLKTEVTTIHATFVELTKDEPPCIRLHKLLRRPDGGQKPFSMSVPVVDARLLARLRSELSPGDLIEATVETRWDEAGIPKTLSDFFSSLFAPRSGTGCGKMSEINNEGNVWPALKKFFAIGGHEVRH